MRIKLLLTLSPGEIASLVLGILLFAGLITLSFWMMRWLQRRDFPGVSSEHMSVVERLVLGRDSALLLVSVGVRLFVIGQSRDGLCFISELSSGDFSGEMKDSDKREGNGFFARFLHNLKVNARLAPKGTPYRRPGDDAEAVEPPGELSFGEMLRQMAAREESQNPMQGGLPAPQSGYAPVKGSSPPLRNKEDNSEREQSTDYQESLNRLLSLSQSDTPDRRTRPPQRPHIQTALRHAPPPPPLAVSAPPPAEKPAPAKPTPQTGREEKIDELLERIAERQSRYNK